MFSNKGNTLVEALLAFLIFTTTIILFVSLYSSGLKKYSTVNKEYKEYLLHQRLKEQRICLDDSINQILKALQ